MTCGFVGPVAVTVIHRKQRRQHGPFYAERRLSQYRFLIGLTHSGCFRQNYLQALSVGLAGYSVAQSASDLSMFLTGTRTDDLRLVGVVVVAVAAAVVVAVHT